LDLVSTMGWAHLEDVDEPTEKKKNKKKKKKKLYKKTAFP